MRVVTAVSAVIALVLLAILGASAGEIPTFDLLQPAVNRVRPAAETAVRGLRAPAALWLRQNQLRAPAWLVQGEAQACWPVIVNPGFEGRGGWDLPITLYPAAYSQEQVFAGEWAMKTGINAENDNRQSYSSASQLVAIPATISTATLTFRLFPQTTEDPALAIPEGLVALRSMEAGAVGDAQWVLILDENGRELERLVSMRSNAQTWEMYEFDVSAYAGRRIRIYFGSFNNGWSGVTALFADEVQLVLCGPEAPRPTATPTATHTPRPTATATPTNTPAATATPAMTATATAVPPLVCVQGLLNGGFETDSAWRLPFTNYAAEYSQEQAYAGERSLRTGITQEGDNILSYSSATQMVAIPAEATVARLSFYLFPQTTEPPNLIIPDGLLAARNGEAARVGDAQWVLVLDRRGNELGRLVSMRSNAQTWSAYEFDLLPYKGRTIQIYFGTFNNGLEGITALFVDEAALELCTGQGPAATPSPTPASSAASVGLPAVFGDAPVGISGRIVDEQVAPLEGLLVTISPSQGGSFFVFTGPGGTFSLALAGAVDTFEIRPSSESYTFTPQSRTASIPPSAAGQDFVARLSPYP